MHDGDALEVIMNAMSATTAIEFGLRRGGRRAQCLPRKISPSASNGRPKGYSNNKEVPTREVVESGEEDTEKDTEEEGISDGPDPPEEGAGWGSLQSLEKTKPARAYLSVRTFGLSAREHPLCSAADQSVCCFVLAAFADNRAYYLVSTRRYDCYRGKSLRTKTAVAPVAPHPGSAAPIAPTGDGVEMDTDGVQLAAESGVEGADTGVEVAATRAGVEMDTDGVQLAAESDVEGAVSVEVAATRAGETTELLDASGEDADTVMDTTSMGGAGAGSSAALESHHQARWQARLDKSAAVRGRRGAGQKLKKAGPKPAATRRPRTVCTNRIAALACTAMMTVQVLLAQETVIWPPTFGLYLLLHWPLLRTHDHHNADVGGEQDQAQLKRLPAAAAIVFAREVGGTCCPMPTESVCLAFDNDRPSPLTPLLCAVTAAVAIFRSAGA
jgi:hypothetical protein